MFTFWGAIIMLITGYFVYGKIVEKCFGIAPDRPTPALARADNVDYVQMGWWRVFLIQLLNISGLGPIFGAIAGALWGPVVFVWIVFGCIFAGAVHDFMSGMLSVRNNGSSASEIAGKYLGRHAGIFMRFFSVVLLVLVGAVFVSGPAKLLESLTPQVLTFRFWTIAIILYYLFATVLPINKLIGRLYPLFGVSLVVMCVGIVGGFIYKGHKIPELTFTNLHPKSLSIWPLMCVTVACGAISGFHATQSPMMARCIKNEKHGRKVFYGAMIAEGVIALIWAAVSMSFFGGTEGLSDKLAVAACGGVVHEISVELLGGIGGVLAMLGVVVCPITSGDTAFRSARLTISDALGLRQKGLASRLGIVLPLFAIGFLLTTIRFDIVWRYFAWSNQTLATIMLWASAVYLKKNEKFHWIASVPAMFMTCVCVTYILQAPEGFGLNPKLCFGVGGVCGVISMVFFNIKTLAKSESEKSEYEILKS